MAVKGRSSEVVFRLVASWLSCRVPSCPGASRRVSSGHGRAVESGSGKSSPVWSRQVMAVGSCCVTFGLVPSGHVLSRRGWSRQGCLVWLRLVLSRRVMSGLSWSCRVRVPSRCVWPGHVSSGHGCPVSSSRVESGYVKSWLSRLVRSRLVRLGCVVFWLSRRVTVSQVGSSRVRVCPVPAGKSWPVTFRRVRSGSGRFSPVVAVLSRHGGSC